MILLQRFSKTVLKNIELLSKKMCFSPNVWLQKISIQDSLIYTPPPPQLPRIFCSRGSLMTPSPLEFPEFLNGDFLTPWENIYTSATDDEWKFLGGGEGAKG